MQTSAARSLEWPARHHGARAASQRGFTLIELMVVAMIVALAAGMVVFSLRDTRGIALEREGQRLAALLEYARAQSRLQGTPVHWRVTRNGFALDGLDQTQSEQTWLNAETRVLDVLPHRSGADASRLATLALGPEPVLAAQSVLLGAGPDPVAKVRVGTDGLRPFAIVPAESVPPSTGASLP